MVKSTVLSPGPTVTKPSPTSAAATDATSPNSRAAYVRSRVLDAGPLTAAVLGRLPADPARFPITTHSGCLVCS